MATQVKVFLQDAESEQVYSVYVTTDEAKRLEKDIVFATQKLQEAKNALDNSNTTNCDETIHDDSLNSREEVIEVFKWPHEAILLLIEEYNARQNDFVSGKMSQKKMWSMIMQTMVKNGYNVTGPQCLSKFSGLKRTYKAVKNHNNKSRNGTRSWPYFSHMNALLGSKPYMSSIATVSSTGKRTLLESEVSMSSINSCIDTDDPTSKHNNSNTTNCDETIQDDSLNSREEVIGVFKWPHEAILLLIEEYNVRQNDFVSGKMSQKKMWSMIEQTMIKNGYNVTGPQCLSKFSGLKRTYKAVKDHNNKFGSGTRSWPYFSHMDTLLGSKPDMSPIATESSTRKRTLLESEASTDSCIDTDDPTSRSSTSKHKKFRQANNMEQLIESLKEERQIAENAVERRHKENVELRVRLLSTLDKLIDILTKK